MRQVELTEDGELMNTVAFIICNRGFNPEDFRFSAIETVKNSGVYMVLLVDERSNRAVDIIKVSVYN